jgi:hypothetical protein
MTIMGLEAYEGSDHMMGDPPDIIIPLSEELAQAFKALSESIKNEQRLEDEVLWRDKELQRLGNINKQNAAVMPLARKRIEELEAELRALNKLLKKMVDEVAWLQEDLAGYVDRVCPYWMDRAGKAEREAARLRILGRRER